MKVNKIICDICKQEIDLKTEPVLGSFQKIEVKSTLSFNKAEGDQDKQIAKEEYDLCKNCTEKIRNYVLKEKNESK